MTAFLLAAAALMAAVLALLSRPFWRRTAAGAGSRQALNAAIYRDQLAELERDRDSGQIDDADYQQARGELQRRLIEDAAEADPAAVPLKSPKRTLALVALMLPLGAAGLYAWLGNPAALDPAARRQVDAGQIAQMVDTLAAKLEQNPDNLEGWTMLGRSYKALGRYGDAARAFGHLAGTMGDNADFLADYAEVLAMANGNSLAGQPSELVAKALKIDPDHIQALLLAGAAAMERRDYAAAVAHWERLLKLLPPDSEDADTLSASLLQARQKLQAGKASAATAVSGRIELAPAVKAQAAPEDMVFLIARAPEAGPMPVAVLRLKVSDLPMDFRLDDSHAMSPDHAISGAKAVNLEARVSKGGNAAAKPGDLSGSAGPVKPGAKGVRLRIDRVL